MSMRAAGVIFEAKHRKPVAFLSLIFLTTLSLLFFSFHKSISGDYQPLMGSYQYPVATPMQTTYVNPTMQQSSPYQQTLYQNAPQYQQPSQASVPQQRFWTRNMVSIRRMLFSPSTVTVPAGTMVLWVNNETDISHTVTSDNGLWDSGTLGPGQSFARTFSVPGTYTYHCNIHPFMHGTVVVVPRTPTMTPPPIQTVTPMPSTFPMPSGFQQGQPFQQQMQPSGFGTSSNFQTQSQTQNNNQNVNVNVTR